jgi:hypothetical protein
MKLSGIFSPMKMSVMLCAAVMAAALPLSAQDQASKPSAAQPAPVAPAPPAPAVPPAPPEPNDAQAREWVPDGIAALGQGASSRTEFTLDHSMLVLASKLDANDADLRRVIAGVNGVSVHSFRFPVEVALDPALLDSIGQQYREAGWQHLVSKHKNDSGTQTDLWVRLDQSAIRDVAVLLVGARHVDFVSATGSVTPLDLLHLSGHFGIPKMDGGVAVPVPNPK